MLEDYPDVLNSQKGFLEKYQIIIDEDILKTIVSNQGYVDTENIENALSSNLPDKVMEKLDFIYTKLQQNEYFEYLKVLVKNKFNADFDIQALLKTEHFCSEGKKICFCKTPNLLNVKYVVLSATASEYVYKKYFGENRVVFYRCREAEYIGKLKQYHSRSYSRNFFKKNDTAAD